MANENQQDQHDDDLDDLDNLDSHDDHDDDHPDDQHEEDNAANLEREEHPDEDREAIRERRRKERQDRKVRRKEYEEGLKAEINRLKMENQSFADRMASIEKKTTSSELMQLDQAIGEMNNYAIAYKNQIAEASARNDHAGIADATEKMLEARNKAQQLANIKQNYSRQQVNQPRGLDVRAQSNMANWLSKNSWYNPNANDMDTQIVKSIDTQIALEGYNPSTEAYWNELDNRVSKYLPQRQNGSRIPTGNKESRNKPVVTGDGRAETPNRSVSFRLSADRAKALEDAGYAPGTPKYNEMVKRYREYDNKTKSN